MTPAQAYDLTHPQVLANFAVLLALFGGHVVQRIFFGSLRANEIEVRYQCFAVPTPCSHVDCF